VHEHECPDTTPEPPSELHVWDASGPDGATARGVTTEGHQAAERELAAALVALPPGPARGTVRQAWLDLMDTPSPGYRYGPVQARARRNDAGAIHITCTRCPAFPACGRIVIGNGLPQAEAERLRYFSGVFPAWDFRVLEVAGLPRYWALRACPTTPEQRAAGVREAIGRVQAHTLFMAVARQAHLMHRANDVGSTGRQVAANLRRLRDERGLSTTQLSRLLAEVGRPIQATGITKIEKGLRKVDVDDLFALAYVLDVAPVHLLVPFGEHEAYSVAPASPVELAADIRSWVRGFVALTGTDHRRFYMQVPRHEIPGVEGTEERARFERALKSWLARVGGRLMRREDGTMMYEFSLRPAAGDEGVGAPGKRGD
jgi:transcriptional regulator with XRE-family HTH domain